MDTIYECLSCWCRTCMFELTEETGTRVCLSIFDTVDEFGNLTLAELLSQAFREIEVHFDDDLSEKICSECVVQLLNAYRFHQTCLKSDQAMRELRDKNNASFELTSEQLSGKEQKIDEITIDASKLESKDPNDIVLPPQANTAAAEDPLQINSEDYDGTDSMIETSDYITAKVYDDHHNVPNIEYIDENKESMMNNGEKIGEKMGRMKLNSARHTCARCSKSFKDSLHLRNHLRIHIMRDEQYGSPTEGKYEGQGRHKFRRHFPDSNLVKKLKTAEEKKFACELCGMMFSRRFAVNRHKRLRHSDCNFLTQNVECDSADVNKEEIRIEKKQIKLVSPTHTCTRCRKSFNELRHYRNHMWLHRRQDEQNEGKPAEGKKFACELCGMTFTRRFAVKRHKRLRHSDCTSSTPNVEFDSVDPNKEEISIGEDHIKLISSTHTCTRCSESFNELRHYNNHMLLHRQDEQNENSIETEERKHECEICGMKFSRMFNLKRHERLIHFMDHKSNEKRKPVEEKKFACELCGMMFSRRFVVNRHKLLRHSDCNYSTQNKDFVSAASNNEQISIEEDQEELISPIHKRKPAEEKKFACDLCGMMFSRRFVVNRHKRLRHSDCNYSTLNVDIHRSSTHTCTRCGKSFSGLRHYKNHLLLHRRQDERYKKSIENKERKHVCEVCGMKFSKIFNLKRHQKLRHFADPKSIKKRKLKEEKKFACELCGTMFSRRFAVKRHIRLRHSEYKDSSRYFGSGSTV